MTEIRIKDIDGDEMRLQFHTYAKRPIISVELNRTTILCLDKAGAEALIAFAQEHLEKLS